MNSLRLLVALEVVGALGVPIVAQLLCVFYGWDWWVTVFYLLPLWGVGDYLLLSLSSLRENAVNFEREVIASGATTLYASIVRLTNIGRCCNKVAYALFFTTVGVCFCHDKIPGCSRVEGDYVYYDACEHVWKAQEVKTLKTYAFKTPWAPILYTDYDLDRNYLRPVGAGFRVQLDGVRENKAEKFAACLNLLQPIARTATSDEQIYEVIHNSKLGFWAYSVDFL